jgi:hypothetical protein
MKANRRYHNTDDFDDNGLLRDGKSYRVKMTLMDADTLQRAQQRDHVTRISDGTNNPFGCNKPGWRVAVADTHAPTPRHVISDAQRQAVLSSREEYLDSLVNAWRHPPGVRDDDPITGAGEKGGFLGKQREGSPCTRDGWPGVLRRGKDGEFFCDISAKTDAALIEDRERSRKVKFDPQGRYAGREEIEEEEEDDDEGDARRRRIVEEPDGDDDDDDEGYESAVEQIYANTATHHESTRPHVRGGDAALKKQRKDHEQKMSALYDAMDRSLSAQWRQTD